MSPNLFSKAKLLNDIKRRFATSAAIPIVSLGLLAAAAPIGAAQARGHSHHAHASHHARRAPARRGGRLHRVSYRVPVPASPFAVMAWQGADFDGDGSPDFANPTGGAPRTHDAFGDGFFHAERDGGHRAHEGVDYDARPGQTVVAPIAGYVTKIGFAYPGDTRLRYVEIENPILKLTARALYVDPSVHEGDTVRLGQPIGAALSLQRRYPGITNHVHLELAEQGRKIDAQTVILAKRDGGSLMTAMN
jgi:murein DD-endopeptidase MepM/ murein hydrolase activator NlpD